MKAQHVNFVGRHIVRFLERPISGYEPATPPDFDALRRTLKPADVLLVEGNSRIAGVIKYMTQSTWSHAVIYLGDVFGKTTEDGEPHVLLEADVAQGVISIPLSKYKDSHIRICRPVALREDDCRRMTDFLLARLGISYDLKNIMDLARYLMPLPIPQRFRRRLMALGSGDPSRAICSTLIAEAFQSVHYPILTRIENVEDRRKVRSRYARTEIMRIRHHSLYAPRDFDISPYFGVVKPTIEAGFDYKSYRWNGSIAVAPARARAQTTPEAEAEGPAGPQTVPVHRRRHDALPLGAALTRAS